MQKFLYHLAFCQCEESVTYGSWLRCSWQYKTYFSGLGQRNNQLLNKNIISIPLLDV